MKRHQESKIISAAMELTERVNYIVAGSETDGEETEQPRLTVQVIAMSVEIANQAKELADLNARNGALIAEIIKVTKELDECRVKLKEVN